MAAAPTENPSHDAALPFPRRHPSVFESEVRSQARFDGTPERGRSDRPLDLDPPALGAMQGPDRRAGSHLDLPISSTARGGGSRIGDATNGTGSQIRILLVELPQMLRDLVKALFAGRHEVEFVGEIERADELLPALAETEANVVLVGVREEALSPGEARLLVEPPHVRVLTIRNDGRRGDLYRIDAVRVPIEELSADALLGAVAAEVAR